MVDKTTQHVLETLSKKGRVEVDDVTGPEARVTILDTPEGRVGPLYLADSVRKVGMDVTRNWTRYGYKIAYSVDRTPGNDTHTLLVKEVTR